MLILDTDHISELDRSSAAGTILRARLAASSAAVATTIVSVEEQLRGRFAQLARTKDAQRLIAIYAQVQKSIAGFARWQILPWDDAAARMFERLHTRRLGLGTMDMRIASIVLANDAKLLSRNLRDFGRIADLQVESWLE